MAVDPEALAKRLLATFRGELDEHVRVLDRTLLALERGLEPEARAEALRTVFREVHSLKGAARAVSLGVVERACHRVEESLAGAREGVGAADAAWFARMFALVDALRDVGARLDRDEPVGEDAPIATVAGPPGPSAPVERPPPERPPPERHPPAERPPPPRPEPEGVVRVAVRKLDALLVQTGELGLARRRAAGREEDLRALRDALAACFGDLALAERGLAHGAGSAHARDALRDLHVRLSGLDGGLARLARRVADEDRALEQAATPLDASARALRMLPFGQACEGLDRVARDLAQAEGKQVELVVEGADVEMDRAVLEGVRDAMLHLVRNAVDHGIETPSERARAGKRPRGVVTLAATLVGGAVEIAVRDDGRGLDLEAVHARARALGIAPPEDPRTLARLVLRAGFTTAEAVSEVSGRGVGLDIVRERIEAVHGSVDVTSAGGVGFEVRLSVPLTLSALRVVLVRAGGQVHALPVHHVHGAVRVPREALRALGGVPTARVRGEALRVAWLATLLGGRAEPPAAQVPVLGIGAGERRVALAVDELLAEREIVVHGLGRRLARVPLVAGATFLPDGRVALLLRVPDLVDAALAERGAAPVAAAAPEARRHRILVVDDSVTSRTLVRMILEGAGFEVRTASDGDEAWALLQREPVDVVVSDVEMPRVDGVELTRRVRASARLNALPVVLLTALGDEMDRARGLEAGASAYLVKSAFHAEALVEAIQRHL